MIAFESMPVGTQARPYKIRTALPSPYYTHASGIYAIINRGNGKVYIGSAVKLNHRWTEHRCSLEDGKHHSRYLQRAFNKTPDAFEVEVIEELPNADKQKLISREQFWLHFYKSYEPEHGYNISPTANSCQGVKRTPEYCKKIGDSKRGRKYTPERMLAHINRRRPTKFRTFTPEQRKIHSEILTGRKHSKTHCENISKGLIRHPSKLRKVCQYSSEGKFIKLFDSIMDAEEAIGFAVGDSNISGVCKGKNRSSGGYLWRYYIGIIIPSIEVPPLMRKGRFNAV